MQTHQHKGSDESETVALDGRGKATIPPLALLEEKANSLGMHWYVEMIQLFSLLDKLRATDECTLSDIDTVASISIGCYYVQRGTSAVQSEVERVVFFIDCICKLITGLGSKELYWLCKHRRIDDVRKASKIIADHFAPLKRTSLSQ